MTALRLMFCPLLLIARHIKIINKKDVFCDIFMGNNHKYLIFYICIVHHTISLKIVSLRFMHSIYFCFKKFSSCQIKINLE